MFLSLLCLTLAITGYRKGNVYDMDSFSRNNYVIVGSRTLHCEPPQVYQPTPDPPPPGEETLMSIELNHKAKLVLSEKILEMKDDHESGKVVIFQNVK